MTGGMGMGPLGTRGEARSWEGLHEVRPQIAWAPHIEKSSPTVHVPVPCREVRFAGSRWGFSLFRSYNYEAYSEAIQRRFKHGTYVYCLPLDCCA